MASQYPSSHDLMADLSDVENAVVSKIVNGLYPNGTAQDSAIGVICRIYRGWPLPAALNSDLAAGIVNVTVFPAAASDELAEPYFDAFYADVLPSTLTTAVEGQDVTFTGLVVKNQIVGVLVDGIPYIYQVAARDTAGSVAANLATLMQLNRNVLLSGSTITIPGAISLSARVATNTTVSRGLRRQRREIQISCWCPTPLLRDSVCKISDLTIASQSFIDLADGTKAHVRYASTQVYDQSQNALLYRRDLCYKCEYTVVGTTIAPIMLFGDLVANKISLYH
jgi:hypothetical protein